ncbi:MAG: hypothetical protein ABUL57_00585, partial [Chloroflexota bacterium]
MVEDMSGRMRGACLGFAVAVLFVIVGTPICKTVFRLEPRFVLGGLALPTIATGILTGYLFGRRRSRPEDWSDVILQSLGMAFLATAVGALFVGFAMGYGSADGNANIVEQLIQGIASGLVIWPFGIVLFGVAGMPVTFVAGLLWSIVM